MESVDLNKERTKKPYETPELVNYGDIRMITEANTMTGARDDAGRGNDKT